MALTTINAGKELAVAYRPVVLCSFTFPDGATLHVSTHNGDAAHGGYSYSGVNYLPRIEDEEIDRLASLSEQGIDRVPSVTIKLADPDGWVWTTYERGHGFKGAQVLLRLVLHDPATGAYSTDSLIPFLGACEHPAMDDKNLTVTAQARLNLTRFMLPSVQIQQRCPWINPVTADQRTKASNPLSAFYLCGETRDTAAAPPCAYTKQTCTQPRRFGGVTWEPISTDTGREYISGNKISWRNADTSGKYKDYWPLFLGGLCWLTARPLNVVGDGNYTRGEAAIGFGEIEVQRVIVNGVELSYSPGMTGDFRWHYVNDGSRDGTPNHDRPYNSTGDPYGNLTAIQWLTTRNVVDPSSEPNIRVLARRKKIRIYRRIASASASGGEITIAFDGPNEDCAGNAPFTVTVAGCGLAAANGTWGLLNWAWGPPGTITLQGSSATGSGAGGVVWYEGPGVFAAGQAQGASTPWVLAEALDWVDVDFSVLDTGTFADVAKVCNGSISYGDQSGSQQTQARFSTSVAIRDRRSAAEVIRGLRQSIGAALVPGPDGKIRLLIEGPLAEQQPTAVDGSNYNTPVASKKRDGSTASGYAAYRFDESNSWGLKRSPRQLADAPNRVAFPFQDPVQGYAISNFALVDSDDLARTGQEISGGLQVNPEGIASQNHALRCAKLGLAKIHRGNPANDTRGTDWYEWSTSFRGCKLAVGQIVLLNDARLGLTNQMVRLTEIKPARNFETVALKGHWHSDDWYLDSAANADDPAYSAKRRDRLARPAFPWLPDTAVPITGDPMSTERTFALIPSYETRADGTVNVRVKVRGKIPVNTFTDISVPSIAAQASVSTTDGAIPGGISVYVAVVALQGGAQSAPSSMICRADIPSGMDTNKVTIPVYSWDSATDGYAVYAGTNPNRMAWQFDGDGMPAAVDLANLAVGTFGLPDVEFDRLMMRMKRVTNSGLWGAQISVVGSSSLVWPGAAMTPNQWAGYDMSILSATPDDEVPVATFRVTANTVDTLYVTPDPLAAGVQIGWVATMRSQPTVGEDGTGPYLDDPNWRNSMSNDGNGLAVDAEKGNLLRIIAGSGAGYVYKLKSNTETRIYIEGDWFTTPDATSRYIIEEPGWQVEKTTDSLENGDRAAEVSVAIDTDNFKDQTLLFQAITLDGDDNDAFELMAPVREIYVFGASGGARTVSVDGDCILDPIRQNVAADARQGAFTVTLPPFAEWLGLDITIIKVDSTENAITWKLPEGDIIPGVGTSGTIDSQGSSITITATEA